MNKKIKFLRNIFHNFKKNQKYKSIIFFKQNTYYYIVWLEILNAHYEKKKLTLFDLYKILIQENLSKQTASKIIKNAIYKDYLIKQNDEQDKRRSYIFASNVLVEEFEDYFSELCKI